MKRACLYCKEPISKTDWDAGRRFCQSVKLIPCRVAWQRLCAELVSSTLYRFPRESDAVAAWKAIERTLHRIAPEPQETP